MEKEESDSLSNISRWRTGPKFHQELMTTLGADACGRSQIKIWRHKFRNSDLFCKNAPRTRQPSMTLGRNLRHFLENILLPVSEYLPSTSYRVCRRLRKFFRKSRTWKNSRGVPFSVLSPKVARVEVSTEVLWILHESEENHFEEIATGD
jgi:hypothetical protein